VYVLVAHVVMLNMVIALMSDDFADVSEYIDDVIYRQLAAHIVHLESVLPEEKQNDPELFPRWLCWYQPAEREEKAEKFQDKLVKALVNDKEKLLSETDEKIDQVAEDMDKKLTETGGTIERVAEDMVKKLERIDNVTRGRIETTEAKLDGLQSTLDRELQGMREGIDKLLAGMHPPAPAPAPEPEPEAEPEPEPPAEPVS
jgi:hypothetical protein